VQPGDFGEVEAAVAVGRVEAFELDALGRAATSADEVVERCHQLAELGATETWVNPPPLASIEAYLDHLRWVSEEVMPQCP